MYVKAVKITSTNVSTSNVFIPTSFPFPERTTADYGLFFLLRVLAEYFLRLSTVERLCERFCITLSRLRRWLQLFRVQKEDWLGVLSSMEVSGLFFLKSLLTQPAYSDFASAFVRRFTKSFLQSHKNPALYCQQVFGP